MFRVEARISNPGAVKRRAVRAASADIRQRLERTGPEMVRLATEKMEATFNLDRPVNRRRHPGSRRARNALDFQIDGTSLPMTLRYRVLGGEDVLRRILILNFGSRAHRIRPSGTWSGLGANLFGGPVGGAGNPRLLAWQQDGQWIFAAEVYHPGTQGAGFLEDALAEAVQRNLLSR